MATKIKVNTAKKGVSPGSLGTRNAWDTPPALGRQGKLTGYMVAVRKFQPSARVRTAMTPPYSKSAYVYGGAPPRVATAIQNAGYGIGNVTTTKAKGGTKTGSRGGGGKVAKPDTLTRILNRYIAS